MNDNFQPAHSQSVTPTAQAIMNWLIARISENLNVEPASIDKDEPFASYALGSVQSVSLVADLEDWVGQQLPATLLWDHPTLADVSNFLAQQPVSVAATPSSC